MIRTATPFPWTDAVLLVALLSAGAFAVSWVSGELLDLARRPYIAVLFASTALATAATAWWTDASMSTLVTDQWRPAVLWGLGSGALVGVLLRRVPASFHRHGRELVAAEAWEGGVYGVAEGVLLSALPAFAAWQAAAGRDWPTAGRWAVALAASVVVIAVHHFGYWDYRGRHVVPPVVACSILTIGYLASGSLVAPAVGHVLLHVIGVTKGVELPPHAHAAAVHA